jgi:hypothetical protein
LPLAPHSRLGPYLILTPIGAGGMGEVYKANTRLSPNDRTGQGCQYAVLADGRIIASTSSDMPVPATVTLNWAARKP